MNFLLLSLGLSSIISLIFSYLTRQYFKHRGWVEDPQVKHQKTKNATAHAPIPRGGGVPIFVAVTIISLFLIPIQPRLIAIWLASLITLIVGLFDDIKDVNPKIRLIFNLLVSLLIVGSGIGIAYISNPFGIGVINFSSWIISDFITIFWIMWCMNSIGWSAGIKGQLPGFTAISAFFIGLLALRFPIDSQFLVLVLAGAVAGAYLGFLPLNFFPQTMQAGYSGKSLAGFYISILALLSGAKIATVIYLLAIPMIDATIVMIRRIIQGRSPLEGGPEHFHHLLLKHGWSQTQVTLLYWSVSLILGIVSLVLTSQQKFYVFAGIAIVISSIIITAYRRSQPKSNLLESHQS